MTTALSKADTAPTATEPLLKHAVHTIPDPLEANLSGPPSPAQIRVVLTNGGNKAVRCTSIVIELPVGTRPRDLAATGQGIVATATTEGWTAAAPDVGADRVRFAFTPSTAAEIITDRAVSFKIENVPVNRAVGVAYPRIVETSATGADTPVARTGFARLPKFPAGTTATFPVGTNLRVHAGEHASIEGLPPAVSVPHNSKVTVAWNPAPGVVRHLHYRDQADGTPIPDGHTTMVCGPLVRETTFTLQTVSQIGGQPVSRYDAFTLQVDEPEYPKTTVANGRFATLPAGAATRITSPVSITKALTVTETIAAKSTLGITGTVTAPGIKTATTDFAGTLAVTGLLTASNLTAAKVTTTKGLTATGRVDILKAASEPLSASGQRTFSTDGLILANAEANSDLALWVTTPVQTFRTHTSEQVGTLIAPVRAQESVSWGVEGPGAGYTFRWFPFGV
ncbi:hypothetical protein ACIBSV_49660 [Embleya sp. NPDC050154]|uniref:hypothetical protein n=1 Tax=Embleya sp. NPDC050154 TaxID=3363988 RepID=UPI0037AA2730